MSNWKRLSSKIVYQNDYKTVHEDEVIRPDGRSASYAWVEMSPSVFIVAVNEDGEVCLVEQERYTTGSLSWELPAGQISGEDELSAAKRELAEEARLHADHWKRLSGEVYPYSGTVATRLIVFVATGLHQVRDEAPETDDTITQQKWVSWHELGKMMKASELTDGQTITALTLAGLHLGRVQIK